MKKFLKTIPYLAALALTGFFLFASFYPARLAVTFYGVIGVAALASGALFFFAMKKQRPIAPEILPALLAASSFFAMLFVEETVLRVGISLIVGFLFFILVKQLPAAVAENYFTELLRAIAEWSVMLVVFMTGAGLAAAMIFLNFSQYGAFLIFLAIAAILSFGLYTLSPAPSAAAALAFSVFIAESFWVVNLFPFSYWVNAGFLAAMTYTLIGVARGASSRELRRSALTAAGAVLLLFGSARWR
jgi:hypothetical protein